MNHNKRSAGAAPGKPDGAPQVPTAPPQSRITPLQIMAKMMNILNEHTMCLQSSVHPQVQPSSTAIHWVGTNDF